MYATVAGILVDSYGIPWSNAIIRAAASLPGYDAVFSRSDEGGAFSLDLPTSEDTFLNWEFIITPNADIPAVVIPKLNVTDDLDFTKIFEDSTSKYLIPSLRVSRSYSDTSMMSPASEGQLYYNTYLKKYRYFDGDVWLTLGSSTNEGIPDIADYLPLAGGTMTGGIHFIKSVVDNPLDFSKGIEVYPGMGISVTNGSMNFAVNDSSRSITFISGSLGAKIASFGYYEGLIVYNDQSISAKHFMIDGQDSDDRYIKKQHVPIAPDNTLPPPTSDIQATIFFIGDIKQGIQTIDHAGWVILDGREVSSLSATQQTAAATLGFTTNLPNATNLVLMKLAGVIGIKVGSMLKKLSRTQLPLVNIESSLAGKHFHETQACTNDNGIVGMSELLANYGYAIWRRQATIANVNNQFDFMLGRMMEDAGEHTHSFALGDGADFDITPAALAVNVFIFLGV